MGQHPRRSTFSPLGASTPSVASGATSLPEGGIFPLRYLSEGVIFPRHLPPGGNNCTRGTESLFAEIRHGKLAELLSAPARNKASQQTPRLNSAAWWSRSHPSARDERPAQRGRGDGIIKGRGLRGKPAGEVSPKPPSLNEKENKRAHKPLLEQLPRQSSFIPLGASTPPPLRGAPSRREPHPRFATSRREANARTTASLPEGAPATTRRGEFGPPFFSRYFSFFSKTSCNFPRKGVKYRQNL